jgi:hypothetical protein
MIGIAATADAFDVEYNLWCSRLTSLDLSMGKESRETDADVAALVQALPQLCALHLQNYAVSATNAGMQCNAVHGCYAYGAVHIVILAVCLVVEHAAGPAESPETGRSATIEVMLGLHTMHAGLCQLSRLKKLHTLVVMKSFSSCTYVGLVAVLATMTGAALDAFA